MTTLVDTLRPGTTREAGAGASLLARLADRFAEHRRYRRTLVELSTLTDRELEDIGITRGDVEAVARRSARAA